MKKKTAQADLTPGPLLWPIILFALPVLGTGVLQFLYNAADTVVVGRFVGKVALAAVGSTGALSNLITGLFIGLSVGACVAVSHSIGSGDEEDVSEVVHTSIGISVILGLAVGVAGYFLARPLLSLMDVPDNVIGDSSKYMRIIFLGMPAQMVYNYGAAILRAKGDTRHPFFFLVISGMINVILNLVFVISCHMGVAGVAVATIVSQYVSAALVTFLLCTISGPCRLYLQKIRIRKQKLVKIIRIGLPAGVQSILFSFSNVLIQSSINSFGDIAMAGNTAAANVDGVIYIACNSFYHTALTFTGQNLGAKRFDRIKKTCGICLLLATCLGLAIAAVCYLFGPQLLSIYADPEEDMTEFLEYGMTRLLWMGLPYFLCGVMEVMSGMLRGIGASMTSMIVSLTCSCVLRVVWIETVFRAYHDLGVLYASYPLSWILTTIIAFICYKVILSRIEKRVRLLESTGLPDAESGA